jgi:hypothetical protein
MNDRITSASGVKANGVTLYFVEVCMDGIWSAIGAGWATRDEALWSLAMWRQDSQCHLDHLFRIEPHTLAAPPEVEDEDDSWVDLGMKS